jgi:hypothetical protein
MVVFALVCTVAFWIAEPDWYQTWMVGLLILGLAVVSQRASFNIVIRRSAFDITVTEVPLVLGLYYLSPVMMVVIVASGMLFMQLSAKYPPVKMWFNVASATAAICAALLVKEAFPPTESAGPATWGVLFVAMVMHQLMQVAGLAGVMSVVNGPRVGQDVLRASWSGLVIAGTNVAAGLLFLIALEASKWSVFLLIILVTALILVLRSYAGFFRQHQTLADVYELTKAVQQETSDNALPDVLLGRVRALMRAEYATLWLARQGRYPEVLLSAQVDNKGLLDLSPVPATFRDLAFKEQRPISVGSQFSVSELLSDQLRAVQVKDVVIVPLRSGQTTIGTLEAANRLGESRSFRDGDVQVLETVAAHVAVAV